MFLLRFVIDKLLTSHWQVIRKTGQLLVIDMPVTCH